MAGLTRDRQTFLFTDLVGFTALTEANGDDRAAELAHDFYDRVRRLLPTHGALEVKTIGDAMMLRCPEPDRAILLGLAIVRELEAVPGLPAVRVGMHTGPAVERGGDWYGGTVNVAARLCSAAGGGQVLASEATHSAAGRLRCVERAEPELHWLKNVTQPVSASLVYDRECSLGWWRMKPLRLLGAVSGARS